LRSLSDAALEQYFATAYARQAAEILLVSQVADQLSDDARVSMSSWRLTRQTLATAQASYTIVKLAVRYRDGAASSPPAGSIGGGAGERQLRRCRYELVRKPRTAWCC